MYYIDIISDLVFSLPCVREGGTQSVTEGLWMTIPQSNLMVCQLKVNWPKVKRSHPGVPFTQRSRALYDIEHICSTIRYRATRLGNSRVTELTKTNKIRRKNGNNQFPLQIAIFTADFMQSTLRSPWISTAGLRFGKGVSLRPFPFWYFRKSTLNRIYLYKLSTM